MVKAADRSADDMRNEGVVNDGVEDVALIDDDRLKGDEDGDDDDPCGDSLGRDVVNGDARSRPGNRGFCLSDGDRDRDEDEATDGERDSLAI